MQRLIVLATTPTQAPPLTPEVREKVGDAMGLFVFLLLVSLAALGLGALLLRARFRRANVKRAFGIGEVTRAPRARVDAWTESARRLEVAGEEVDGSDTVDIDPKDLGPEDIDPPPPRNGRGDR